MTYPLFNPNYLKNNKRHQLHKLFWVYQLQSTLIRSKSETIELNSSKKCVDLTWGDPLFTRKFSLLFQVFYASTYKVYV